MTPPVVAGGMGGSGTRVVARILMHAGRYLGTNRNVPQEDALEFAEFDYRWAPAYLAARATGRDLPPREAADMRREFETALERHLAGLRDPAESWGWKHSPSVHLLPFLHERLAGLRFVHVIRDGRDAAFGESGGRTHVLRLGRAVLDGDPTPVTPETPQWRGRAPTGAGGPEATPARKAMFWRVVNVECADYAESALGDRYLRLRLEDLCRNPRESIETLLAFAGTAEIRPGAVDRALAEVEAPQTVGRWRTAEPAAAGEVGDALQEALARFGYLTSEAAPPPDGGS